MRGLYPEESIPFHLPIHGKIPADRRPTFLQRSLVARQRFALDALIDEAAQLERQGKTAEALDKLLEALALTLAGWKNIDLPFDPKLLPDHLDYGDIWAVYTEGMAALRLSREELKKSESPSESDTASTAATAPSADGPNATTSQPRPNPPSSPAPPATA